MTVRTTKMTWALQNKNWSGDWRNSFLTFASSYSWASKTLVGSVCTNVGIFYAPGFVNYFVASTSWKNNKWCSFSGMERP